MFPSTSSLKAFSAISRLSTSSLAGAGMFVIGRPESSAAGINADPGADPCADRSSSFDCAIKSTALLARIVDALCSLAKQQSEPSSMSTRWVILPIWSFKLFTADAHFVSSSCVPVEATDSAVTCCVTAASKLHASLLLASLLLPDAQGGLSSWSIANASATFFATSLLSLPSMLLWIASVIAVLSSSF
jgi:hypothetical protein